MKKPSPLLLIAGGLAIVAYWLTQRQKAAAAGSLTPGLAETPAQYSFGDIGARVLNEDARDEVVKALLEDANRTRSRIAYEDATMTLTIRPTPIDDRDPYVNQWDTKNSQWLQRP